MEVRRPAGAERKSRHRDRQIEGRKVATHRADLAFRQDRDQVGLLQQCAYPTDLKTRADVNRWLLWECGAWFATCYVHLVENCVKPLLGDTTDQSVLDAEAPNFHKLAGILDARLAGSTWVCGDHPTIADVAVAAPMHLHGWAKLPLDDHANIRRWMSEQVETAPWWKATHVGEGFTLPDAA